jgi:single-strand DNA-binding protein
MLNNITIMGRLTKDPELRYTQSGTAVTSFTLAVERDYSGKDSEKQVDFIDFLAWRNTAEFLTKYFSKGRMVVVAGRLQTRFWEDKNGTKHKAVEVVAENVYFGDSKKESDGSGYQSQYHTAPQAGNAPSSGYDGFTELDGSDDELPF